VTKSFSKNDAQRDPQRGALSVFAAVGDCDLSVLHVGGD